ncbi:aldose 1-epimerase [Paenibacillus spiritus]|uniref:Aldose 1-epimerase n=1 Tax=Paenibacillus spiritus TaxID=2496557 RepID=A0A5J5GMB4_9BACL|nr:aldose 1-epimerase [Paenibacillus spiritus]KAA9008632.1 aldose 1-epimerase [Paenibacillus spiritus]
MKQVTKGQWNGYDTYILHSSELEVTLLPRLGNHVISIRDLRRQREVLRRPEESDLDFYMQKPYHFGVPLLIPPGRIRDGRFAFGEDEYQFDRNGTGGHHIHGLHRTQSWCVSDIQEDEDGCALTAELRTENDPNWIRQFPEPLVLEMTLRLQGASLTQTLRVTHAGKRSVPFGMGYHTWFLIDGEPERWHLKLPVSGIYEQSPDLLPSGRLLPLGELEALNNGGSSLSGTNFDTPLRIGDDQPAEALLLREDGYGLRYTADRRYFRHWVLYTKGPADQYLCIEPYTWLPDAPNVSDDADFTGLIALDPGQTLELSTMLELIEPEAI